LPGGAPHQPMTNQTREAFDAILTLREVVDAKTAELEEQILIPCKRGCSRCCYQPISLYLVEYLLIRESCRQLKRDKWLRVLSQAEKACRKIDKFIQVNRLSESTADMHRLELECEIRCPFLFHNDCMIYEYRPICCRVYGWPQSLGDGSFFGCAWIEGPTKVDISISMEAYIGIQSDANKRLHQSSRIHAPSVSLLPQYLRDLPDDS